MAQYCDNFRFYDQDNDSFEFWNGLRGPYYIPHLSADGVLSWTNTGELPNPAPVNISGPPGSSVELRGPVDSVEDLPASASSSELWLVGTASPYDGWFYNGVRWENAGQIAVGPPGPAGQDGVSPEISVTDIAGGHRVTITDAGGTETFDVLDGAAGVGVPAGGSTGQVLKKRSGTNYDTEWANESGGSGGGIGYGVCSDYAYTAAKTVTITGITELTTGLCIRVLFTGALTATNPTLNVNNLGAKAIRNTSSTAASAAWRGGEVLDFVYDGTYWLIVDGGLANESYYGATKLATSAELDDSNLALTPAALYRLANGMIAPVYSTSSTYAVGDRVRYGYKLYECSTAIASPEIWTAAHWTELDPLADLAGSGGTSDYEALANKPSINSVPLSGNKSAADLGLAVPVTVTNVSGTSVTLTGAAETRYICGTLDDLTFTPPVSGIVDIVFTSGATATVLSLPNTVNMPEWFEVEANRIYEISIMDGVFGAVMSWPV